MATTNFIEALMELKRKSKLMGRPPSTREISAVSEGYFSDASSRLARQKQLELQERELSQSKELAEKDLALQRERFEAEKEAAEQARESGRFTSAMGGALAGFMVGGPVGAGFGAAFGFMGGGGGGGCIIVSACTSRYSYETDITRKVRDRYLGPITLSGYYALGSIIVPWIRKSSFVKTIINKCLVDRLIDYGKCLLGYKRKPKYRTSKIITETFLRFCYEIGKSIEIKAQKEIA